MTLLIWALLGVKNHGHFTAATLAAACAPAQWNISWQHPASLQWQPEPIGEQVSLQVVDHQNFHQPATKVNESLEVHFS